MSLSQLLYALLTPALIYCFGNHKSTGCPSLCLSKYLGEQGEVGRHRICIQACKVIWHLQPESQGSTLGHFIDVLMFKAVNNLLTRLVYVAECVSHLSSAL